MARYLETAATAATVINEVAMMIPEEHRTEALCKIAEIYNLGIRTAPRACQSTVRFRAVERAMKELPVHVMMKEVTTDSGKTFNALSVIPKA